MAVYTEKRLYGPAAPGTSNGTLYTAPGSTTTIIKQIVVANTTGSAATLSLSFNGTAATAANCLMSAVSFPANSTTTFDLTQVLAAGDTIQALQGTSAALTVTISGVEKV